MAALAGMLAVAGAALWRRAPPVPPPPAWSLTQPWDACAQLWDAALRHEIAVHTACAWLMMIVGAAVVLVELGGGMQAMYGRYASSPTAKWFGPTIPATAAWVFQESWSFTVAVAMVWFGDLACLASSANRALGAMFLVHYGYRSFIYPLRMRGGKPMPLFINLLASAFCMFNGYLQARLWTRMRVFRLDSIADVMYLACGFALWLGGWYVNLDSDAILRNLRKPGETGYKIPRGGLFEYVSGANYLGECAEWCGYAIASRLHIACVAFAIFTLCNTGPRAYHHHQWYRAKFKDEYPQARRALIPFLW
jgi:3-oxo-5-alpha-steroid 4-dehydrogenase 1